MHKKLGEDTGETRDIVWSEGYPMPYDSVLSDKEKEGEEGKFRLMLFVFPRHC